MNKQRLFVLIASGVGLTTCLLPWFTRLYTFGYFSSFISGFNSIGFLAVLGFIGSGVMAFLGDKSNPMAKTFWFITLGCGGISITGIILCFLIYSFMSYYSVSFGIFLALLAAAGVLVFAFIFKNPSDSIKGGFDSLKGDIESQINK